MVTRHDPRGPASAHRPGIGGGGGHDIGPTATIELPQPAYRDADSVEPEHRRKFYRDAAVVAWPVRTDPRQTMMHRLRPAKIAD